MEGEGTPLTELSRNHDQRSSGISLPTRSASVKVINDAAEAGPPGLQRHDSLEGTMNFYGVRPTSPPSGSNNRPASSSSRPTSSGTTPRARTNSYKSNTSRPTTPGMSLPTSPTRSAVPLPTPRGFFSPKKPASALRLEQKERSAPPSAASRASNPTEHESGPSRGAHRSGEGPSGDIISPQTTSPTRPLSEEGDDATQRGLGTINEAGYQSWGRSIRRSITVISTAAQTHASQLSSDDLVNQHAEKTDDVGHGRRKSVNEKRRSTHPPHAKPPRRRKFKTFENPLTTFFLGGRLMTGGDSVWSMLFVVVVLLGISGVWLGTTGAWLWQHGREYGLVKGGGVAITIIFVYLFGITTSSLLASAFRDPGIIPRKLDLDPPSFKTDDWWEAHPRELTVKSGRVTVKYCETCQSYRPPRSSHCRLCGNCVDGIDHHCSYLHNCVGKRNYFSFLVLLVSASIADIYTVVFSAVHFSLLCHHDHISFRRALQDSPGAAVSFLLGLLVLGPVLFLLSYHTRLLLHNLTTVEQIRASASGRSFLNRARPDNPFASDSLFANVILASMGRPQFPSWIDASGWVDEKTREVNPALTDPKWAREGV
ncbi:hypothetical protein CI109_101710 [Kwoniella shandongensis]|uniref:Palmitoyltransferase n=1 Tax=Kwoniella shandongensis TaxID=1734106 RepID=A0A5M6C5E1_9TREE|nr:uncharacterized protein CI109_001167 [Kwoniella shandongensis]KAA5530366.1 hypothetical protein CI109_001167 [Kwoniella shandongensis]